ncbi:class I SAM-dependent methyltransferase [Variovorax sp. WS11]|uniref:class I SAM-dependent methyltransferase n=1 Tax=Variovorax sp. WS11 TaxID=1105204 RepID=UPI001EF2F79D|nr:class I SAM-dependent methyltransferase [Variovorax sp. WS11]
MSLPSGLAVYNTETTGAVHKTLSLGRDYFCSEYFGDEYAPGDLVAGRRHEDLQRLSFGDEVLDLVLSSDVLEHMPEPYEAHREIFRVLKPGGRHIFTVPFDGHASLDDRRAALIGGEVVYLADKLFHGDPVRPDQGILVWTIFGLEMLVQLAKIGFRPAAWNLHEPEQGIVGPYSLVFEAFKPPAS